MIQQLAVLNEERELLKGWHQCNRHNFQDFKKFLCIRREHFRSGLDLRKSKRVLGTSWFQKESLPKNIAPCPWGGHLFDLIRNLGQIDCREDTAFKVNAIMNSKIKNFSCDEYLSDVFFLLDIEPDFQKTWRNDPRPLSHS